MTLDHLKYLLALSKHRSISKAADSLFISQSALSMSLKNIEKEMHVKLFERNSKGISITPEGQEIIRRAKEILDKVEELNRFIASLSANEKTKLKIASFPLFSGIVMPYLLNDLFETFPGIEIESYEYKDCSTDNALKSFLEESPMDYVIVAYESLQDFSWFFEKNHHSTYCFEPLFDLPAKLYVSSYHPLASKNILTYSDLDQYTTLVSRVFYTHLKQSNIVPLRHMTPIDALNNVERLLLQNDYCFLSPQLFEYENPFVINDDIVPLEFDLSGINLESNYALIYQSGNKELSQVLAQIKWFLNSLKDYF